MWAHPSDGDRVTLQEDLSKHCTFYIQSTREQQLVHVDFHTVHRPYKAPLCCLRLKNRWPGSEGVRKWRRLLFPHCMGGRITDHISIWIGWERNKNQGFHYCKSEWPLRMEGAGREESCIEGSRCF